MDDSLSSNLQTRKSSPKKAKSKKPIKVVYISNPMKVKTSASEFMAIVQKLTGRDAELPDDPAKFTDTEEVDVGNDDSQRVPDTAANNGTVTDYHVKEILDLDRQLNSVVVDDVEQHIPFDVFDDDVFTPQMIEDFTGILPQGHFM